MWSATKVLYQLILKMHVAATVYKYRISASVTDFNKTFTEMMQFG